MDVAQLLADLTHVPHLPGCACRGQSELFDRTVPGAVSRPEATQARQAALKICGQCSALQACADWVDSLQPWYRPQAVVAGRVHAFRDPPPAGMALRRTRWSA